MRQDPISRILEVTPRLDDALDEGHINAVEELINLIDQPLSRVDVEALLSLLPREGDTAYGLSWTVLHIIEAASIWPLWDLLSDVDHEWVEVFIARIRNGDYSPAV